MISLARRPNARIWLAIVGAATIIIGTMYVTAQQINRLDANDLPHIAADAVRESIEKRKNPADIVPTYKVELSRDASIFVIVTNKSGGVIAENALLHGKAAPAPPAGVLASSMSRGHNAVTWQPAADARLASYTEPYEGGFITTGQSLKSYESRDSEYLALAFVAWAAVVIWSTLSLWVWKPGR